MLTVAAVDYGSGSDCSFPNLLGDRHTDRKCGVSPSSTAAWMAAEITSNRSRGTTPPFTATAQHTPRHTPRGPGKEPAA